MSNDQLERLQHCVKGARNPAHLAGQGHAGTAVPDMAEGHVWKIDTKVARFDGDSLYLFTETELTRLIPSLLCHRSFDEIKQPCRDSAHKDGN